MATEPLSAGMGPRSGAFLAVAVLAIGLLAPAFSVRADASPPEVHARWWEPRYAIAPEPVKIFAHVTDADGVREVTAIWCYVPPYLCLYPKLYDDGTNGDEVAGDGVWTNLTESHTGVEGASYKLQAADQFGNSIVLDPMYALFVDSLNLTLDSEVVVAEGGRTVAVNGTAFFEANQTAPAEGVVVDVSAGGSQAQAPVNAAGGFSAQLTAPAADGTYTITALATYRTLTGRAEGTLAVSSVPRPDLSIANLLPSRGDPVAGEPLSVSFRVRNVGTAQAFDARVIAEVVTPGQAVRILDERTNVPPIGGNVLFIAAWTPGAGPQTLRITVDPDGEIDELNEGNNAAELPVDARTPGEPEGPPIALIGAGAATAGAAAVSVVGLFYVRRRRARASPDPASENSKGN